MSRKWLRILRQSETLIVCSLLDTHGFGHGRLCSRGQSRTLVVPHFKSPKAAMAKAVPVLGSTSIVHVLLDDCRGFSVSRSGGSVSRRVVEGTRRAAELGNLTDMRPDVVGHRHIRLMCFLLFDLST